jgi:tetratricopeptide (TPR) repeat protein
MRATGRHLKKVRDIARRAEVSILVGAGVSMNPPACLPSGWGFMTGLLERLSPSPHVYRNILGHTDYRSADLLPGSFLRFESLLERLREHIDPDLRALDCFDLGVRRDEPCNAIHEGLASLLIGGVPVWTTNFDGFIESAARRRGARIRVLYKPEQFHERFLVSGGPAALLKIHGSFRDWRGRVVRDSLKATISSVGRMSIGLDEAAVDTFRASLQTRDLFVAGYSGLDDFDVSDLIATTQSSRGLVWLRHDARAKPFVVYGWRDIARLYREEATETGRASREVSIMFGLGDAGLRPREGLFLIAGHTDEILSAIFPRHFGPIPEDLRCGASTPGVSTLAEHFRHWSSHVARLTKSDQWLFCGILFDDLGDLREAARCYWKTIDWAKRLHRPGQELAAHRNLVAVLTDLEELGPARRLAARLRSRQRRHKNEVSITDRAYTANTLGKLHEALGTSSASLDRARAEYRRAAKLADEAGERELKAIAEHNLGILSLINGRTKEADLFLNRSLETAQAAGALPRVADALIGLARVADRRRDVAGALLLRERARSLYERLGDPDGEFDAILYELESVDSGRVADEDLEELIDRAEKVVGMLHYPYYGAVLKRAVAEVRRHQRKYRLARRLLNEAAGEFERIGTKDGLLAVLAARGFLEAEAGRHAEALEYLRRGYRLSRRLNETLIRSDIVYKLAELLLLRRRAGDALRYVDEAVELNRKVGDPVWVVDSLLLKAEIMLALKRPAEARRCLGSVRKEAALVPRSNVSELGRLASRAAEVESAAGVE